MFLRYQQRAFFQQLCVFFQHSSLINSNLLIILMRFFLHSRQTKRFLRNNIARGLRFKLNLCLLVYIINPNDCGFNAKCH